ncbi:hypothetical protein U9M48_001600 [Paspalum notatum var. saurae]|uniref:BTB domain-containing protein n=1 Tax=Paspalum notatum var. saurae TaxID=547442 RepID=A0AAQ3SIF7_PASNO
MSSTQSTCVFSPKNHSYGVSFLRGMQPWSSPLLADGFHIRCDMAVVDGIATTTRPSELHHHRYLGADLLESSVVGVDVEFEVGGKVFAAHRCVLAAQCTAMAELIGGGTGAAGKEEQHAHTVARVRIDDIEPRVFRALLQFISTDSLPDMDEEGDEAATTRGLLVAADRYGLEWLKLICGDRLCRYLDAFTAVATLELAIKHGCHRLKEAYVHQVPQRRARQATTTRRPASATPWHDRRQAPRWTTTTFSRRSSSAFPRPPLPSSLPRASLVCKRWRRVVTGAWFQRCFRAHHQTAPLLGVFDQHIGVKGIVFNPVLEAPDRVPPQRFSPRKVVGSSMDIDWGIVLLGCRHGRLVVKDMMSQKDFTLVIWDPVAGRRTRLHNPPEFHYSFCGTVLCAATEHVHVHGACCNESSSPYKVVLVSMCGEGVRRPMACVYSSEDGKWGDIIWHDPCIFDKLSHYSTLIGHALYWSTSVQGQGDYYDDNDDEEEDDDLMLEPDSILEFHLDRQSLTVIKGPPINCIHHSQIIKAMDGGVGLVALPYYTMTLQVWHRKVSNGRDAVATWVLFKTVSLHSVLGLQERPRWVGMKRNMLAYDEDVHVAFMCLDSTLFMIELDSMQSKRLYGRFEEKYVSMCLSFRSFYTPGTTMAVGLEGDEMHS